MQNARSSLIIYNRGGQLAARHSDFSGPWKHSGKIIKSEISSNLSQKILVVKLT